MTPAEETDPGRTARIQVEVHPRTLDALASEVGRLRGELRVHAADAVVYRSEDAAAVAELRARNHALAARVSALEAQLDTTGRVEHGIDASNALRDQDRRLLVLRIALVLIPTLAAMITPWLAARDVALPPEAVQVIESAVRAELASPAAAPVLEEPAVYGPAAPPAPTP